MKRLLSIILSAVLALSLLPATALALEPLTISGADYSEEYNDEKYLTEYTITGGSAITIETTDTVKNRRIVIDCNGEVTLKNVDIQLFKCVGSTIEIADGRTVTLILEGTNTLTSYAGAPAILVGTDATLVIKAKTNDSDNLTVTGALYSDYSITDGELSFEVNSSGGYGGITGRSGSRNQVLDNSGTTIQIDSGTVNAYGYGSGAAIGGDSYSSSGNIILSGGVIAAYSGINPPAGWIGLTDILASSIGASAGMPLDKIEICNDASVTAEGGASGAYCAAIGGAGRTGHDGIIEISGTSTVAATGVSGPAIGGYGGDGHGIDVVIKDNATVIATGGTNSPAIGRDTIANPVNLYIGESATVSAYSDGATAAIIATPADGTASIANIYMQDVDYASLEALGVPFIPIVFSSTTVGSTEVVLLSTSAKAFAVKMPEDTYSVAANFGVLHQAYASLVFQILPYSEPSLTLSAGTDAAAYAGTRTMLFSITKNGSTIQRNPYIGLTVYSGDDNLELVFAENGDIIVPPGGQVTVSGYNDPSTQTMTWADGGYVTKGGGLRPNTPFFRFTKTLSGNVSVLPGQSISLEVAVNEDEIEALFPGIPYLIIYRWYYNGERIYGEGNSSYIATESGDYRVDVFLRFGNSDVGISSSSVVSSRMPSAAYATAAKKFELSFETGGGSELSPLYKNAGTVVDLSRYTPERENYIFDGWYADEALTIPISSVTMTSDTTVYAKWTGEEVAPPDLLELPTEAAEISFADVLPGDYFYDAVLWAVGNNVASGVSDTRFAPDMVCSRAQLVTFMWRAMGSPEPVTTDNPFIDVSSGDYYYSAVLWAVENGITTGTSETTFSPDAPVDRAQVVTFLNRLSGAAASSYSHSFTDVGDEYYSGPVAWAVEQGITTGTGETTFSPELLCDRAQAVTFLYRYFSK